ncbi:hypothetical protein [Enterovibrio coralii]|uniref:hypothetical protein n=1 Tax=Enterovibrio coralii TaxID=294935 RepID=UPI000A7DB875|nr:hypothetical protein [Enterovibrio coralii]
MPSAYRALTALKEQLSTLPASDLVNDLLWTIDALTLACNIAQGYAEEGHREVERFAADRKAALTQSLIPLITQYKALWQQHYRDGGCQQSSQRLEYLYELLQVPEATKGQIAS